MALFPSSPPCLRSLSPSPPLFPRQSGFLLPRVQSLAFGSFRRHELLRPSALREWREYEDAVERKDLARALRFLKSIENDEQRGVIEPNVAAPITAKLSDFGALEIERDWQVLDACLNADDMRLVGTAFRFLNERGLLANFGKFSSIVLEGTREVTPTVLTSATGLEVTKLSPKKWGLSGGSSIALAAFLGGASYLLSQDIDVRPSLAVILGLAYVDSVFLGGTCLAQISCYWPPHKRRIIVHEAGHLLVAYLMGCPIRGVILDPIVAMQMGVQGQAGTQFWDQKMESEIAEGRLSGSSFDRRFLVMVAIFPCELYLIRNPNGGSVSLRYSMVLFAGIAAEALVYGDAEGGENDENLFRSISVLLEPPLSVAQMSNQARWSVLQSYNLLKWHKAAHRGAVEALQVGSPLSIVIRRIEEAMSSSR